MCGLEFPDLETRLWQPLRDHGVTVVGVGTGGLYGQDTPEQLQRFVDQTQVTFPVGLDRIGSYGRFPRSGSISPFPLDVVVDREGRIAYVSREYDAEALEEVVNRLAGGG